MRQKERALTYDATMGKTQALMHFISKCAAVDRFLTSITRIYTKYSVYRRAEGHRRKHTRRVASLNQKVLHNSVEDEIVIEALHTELDEVST